MAALGESGVRLQEFLSVYFHLLRLLQYLYSGMTIDLNYKCMKQIVSFSDLPPVIISVIGITCVTGVAGY